MRGAFIKPSEGKAYIFVLMIMMGTFSMLTVSLFITNYGLKVSMAYSQRLNIYGMAESGAIQAENILNAHLSEAYNEIFRKAAADVFDNISEQTVEYRLNDTGDPYGGDFHLKLPDAGGLRGKPDALFAKYFLENAAGSVPAVIGGSGFTCRISLTEKEGADKSSYSVTVKPDNVSPELLASTSVLDGSDISTSILAKIDLEYGEGQRGEILRPQFKWLSRPDWAEAGASAAGEITAEVPDISRTVRELVGDISGTVRESAGDISADTSVSLPLSAWSPGTPLSVVSGGAVDVSGFYDGGEPVYTAIISEGTSELILHASDSAKNMFHGIVFSQGDIAVQEISTMGSLLSQGNITIQNSEGVSVIREDPEALLKINISDDNTCYRLFDYLLLTDFKSTGGAYDLRGVLNRLTVESGGGALEISDADEGLRFRLKSLREVRE